MYEGRDVVRRVKAFLDAHPDATLGQVCKALKLERHTVHRKLRDAGFKPFLALRDSVHRNCIIELMSSSKAPEIQDFLKRLNCSREAFQRLRDRLMRRGEWPPAPD